jgi:hypothetical protein
MRYALVALCSANKGHWLPHQSHPLGNSKGKSEVGVTGGTASCSVLAAARRSVLITCYLITGSRRAAHDRCPGVKSPWAGALVRRS